VATNMGFEIIQNDAADPNPLKKSRVIGESVALIEMMHTTNIFVLVLTNQKNRLVIWDDNEMKNRTEITFNQGSEIKNIKLRKDMLVVILEDKVFVFNFDTLKLIEQVETCQNVFGLCSISTAEKPAQKTIVCLH
jgi:WD repeat-containing protein 45